MSILVENVSKWFGNFRALHHIHLEIPTGCLMALIGPSGSGKSSLLRVISGLDFPDEGRVWLFGRDATFRPIQYRQIGFVFQNYALFNHMTVYENIAFGLKLRRFSNAEVAYKVDELLQLIQMRHLSSSFPSQLSGGQKQRVALARTLAVEPKVLLLDEPFAALDLGVRQPLTDWLKGLKKKSNVTTILVTHDQKEAMEIADELVVFNQGRVEQKGSAQEIYDWPSNRSVLHFLGSVNIFPKDTFSNTTKDLFSNPKDTYSQQQDIIGFQNNLESINHTPKDSSVKHLFQQKAFFLRSHEICLKKDYVETWFPCLVIGIVFVGSFMRIDLKLVENEWLITIDTSHKQYQKLKILKLGEIIYVKPKNKSSLKSYTL
uniref:sulfate ABC transporter protein n=1 Tax=Streptofilum capillatum TaxID=2058781 RepID=UPI00286C2D8B|nr:sulfate ABC transporter protein [Streptofilum capillatum]WKT08521.1 sulfate ABC transporter protein [Streptofilum capillatum]